ncbi:MAG: hypothetical protein QOG30_3510 [Acidimicrobiaceae bacterium]|jgi:hypothetical protein
MVAFLIALVTINLVLAAVVIALSISSDRDRQVHS